MRGAGREAGASSSHHNSKEWDSFEPQPFNWSALFLEETPPSIGSHIAYKEIVLVKEVESRLGRKVVESPYWVARILLVREIQARNQLVQGIREALQIMKRGQQANSSEVRLMKTVLKECMESSRDGIRSEIEVPEEENPVP